MATLNRKILDELNVKQLIEVFDLVTDILFWIKDTQSRLVFVNNLFIEHFDLKSPANAYGKTDLEFCPPHLAQQYMADDQKVLKGEPITHRLEMNINHENGFAWFSTSKRILKDNTGEAIGTYGITRHFQKSSQELATFDAIRIPIEYIRNNFRSNIALKDLAERSHLSVSALERRFKKHLAKTPTQFINEVRLKSARWLLLETDTPISEIAFDTGFSDHSYFTKQFKRYFGIHPSKMREQAHKQKSA
ncbi:AraC family transcriptional regulator [Algibacillus agarilyticus]|uniref:AraC family transcriptional regulator n=1 Tax=Algibacillus agarilyticus TaxID=2234133 RepID=UPI000DCFC5CE|nr:AraC family transcriptional regulator [Algibacillus agarilyticus]